MEKHYGIKIEYTFPEAKEVRVWGGTMLHSYLQLGLGSLSGAAGKGGSHTGLAGSPSCHAPPKL